MSTFRIGLGSRTGRGFEYDTTPTYENYDAVPEKLKAAVALLDAAYQNEQGFVAIHGVGMKKASAVINGSFYYEVYGKDYA